MTRDLCQDKLDQEGVFFDGPFKIKFFVDVAPKARLASPSEMSFAISAGVIPDSYSFIEPSSGLSRVHSILLIAV